MNDNIKKEVVTLPPFKHFCMTIGELPSSYLETMTYYEMLVWFTRYLQNTVIPALNNNAEAVNELQSLFIELKDYVDNYFDSVDFQEMVNDKLDEMAGDGTLAEIINQEIFGALNKSKTNWKNVTYLGLNNDGVTANDTALQTILSSVSEDDVLYFPEGTYYFANKVSFSNLSNVTLRFEGTILSENGVIFDTLTRCYIKDIKVTRNYTRYDYTSLLNTGLEIKNSKYLSIENPYVSGYNKGYFWHSDGQSNSYNTLYNVHSFDNLHAWSVLNENSGFSNEINVFGGRFSINAGESNLSGIADYVVIPTGVSMNNFYGVCLEGAFNKISCAGSYNNFIGCRLEYQDSNDQDVIFTGNSNTLFACYMSEQSGGSKIVNSGLYNKIDNNRQFIIDKIIPKITNTITADYTLNRTYNYILCDCTNGDIKVTLPTNNTNWNNSVIRIRKIDNSNNGVNLFTSGLDGYDYIGRGNILKRIGDYVDLYFDGTSWHTDGISNLYSTSLSNRNQTNIVEGLIFQDENNNTKIVKEGGTVYNSQITNTYCSTTANSADIGLIIGASNRTLQLGNYINIAGETGYFKIVKLDLVNFTATLDRVVTNTNANAQITYHKEVYKYLGLIYDKVDSTPASGSIGDIVIYNTPTAGGYIGAVYTASGWKGFGQIES